MADKNKNISASINLMNERLLFEGRVEGNSPIAIDYIPPFGDNLGYTSLELMLMSLSSCVATALLVFLRRQGKHIKSFSINSDGTRRQSHPTAFEEIQLDIAIESANLTADELEKSLDMVKGICPVYYMIKENTRVIFNHKIAN